MLFDIEDISGEGCAAAIQRAILLQDPTAEVAVTVGDKRVRVEGLLTEQQALATLARAGYQATPAAPHSGEGSECCGGCS